MLSVSYIIWHHHHVLRHRGLPKLWGLLADKFFWPGPLRRRATRKLVFRQCWQAACVILALGSLVLLLTNSAAPPSLTGDKWFSTTNVQPQVHRADRQHSSHIPSGLQLTHGSKQLVQGDDALQPGALPQTTPASSASAVMKAPSRALMLVPSAPVCPAAAKRVLLVEHQRTLVLHPVILPPLLLTLAAADIVHHACPPFTSKSTIADHTSITTDHHRASMIADSAIPPLLGFAKGPSAPLVADVVREHVNLPPRLCNSSSMCCLVSNLGRPVTPTASPITPAVSPIITKAPGSQSSQHAAPGSAHADTWLQLYGWSWSHTLLMGAIMFALGIIVPGLGVWCKFGALTGSVGAATTPASLPKDRITSKLELPGAKAGLALKRTPSSLISAKEFAASSTSPTAPPVQQDRHSLLDSDTIPASYVPDASTAASDQAANAAFVAPEPAGVHPPQPVPPPPSPLPETPAQSGPTAQLAAALESVQEHPPASPNAPVAPPVQSSPHDQLVAAADSTQVPPPISPHAPVAPPAQVAATQPARVQSLPLSPPKTHLPEETQGTHLHVTGHMEPAAAAMLMAPAIVTAAMPQPAIESSHLPVVPPVLKSSISPTTEDVVAPTGCFHFLCCFKASKSKRKMR
ncbi:hypothetical protein ABBQ38_005541 [Trebouxia sp. C0009 RCD-2024]